MQIDDQTKDKLAIEAIEMNGFNPNEVEKYCWMTVHKYRHGVLPVEYDIRDIDEDLYLNVLSNAKAILNNRSQKDGKEDYNS